MAKNYRLSLPLILVKDLDSIPDCDRWHAFSPAFSIRLSGYEFLPEVVDLGLEFGDVLRQREIHLPDLLHGVTRRNVAGTVPIESLDGQYHRALDLAAVVGHP